MAEHPVSASQVLLYATGWMLPDLNYELTETIYSYRRGSRGGEMGEFSPPFLRAPLDGTIDHFLGSKYRRGH